MSTTSVAWVQVSKVWPPVASGSLSFLLVLYERVFLGTRVLPSPQNPTFSSPNSIIRNGRWRTTFEFFIKIQYFGFVACMHHVKNNQNVQYFWVIILSLHESWSVDALGVVILKGYLALLLGVHQRKSGCHWSMLFSENTLLSRSHCKCAVLYFTALFSPCFENSSKSAEDQICAENTFFEKLPPITDTCLIWTPLYYRQLDLFLQKKALIIISSKFNPVNMDSLLIQTLSVAPSVAIFKGFDCIF